VPIRTHRGRAAVYRTVWGWPLRSPRHLAAALLLLAAVGVGVAFVLPGGGSGPATARPSESSRPNAFDPALHSAPPSANAPDRSATTNAQAPAAALAVADAWVRAFLRAPNGITSQQWVAQLRPYTTEEALAELRSVDPANVPDAKISGPPRSISSGSGSAEVDVPTTAVVVRLLLVPTPAGWRVSSFDQAG
jgi:hypothetical protein